jgi:hypothetical protein
VFFKPQSLGIICYSATGNNINGIFVLLDKTKKATSETWRREELFLPEKIGKFFLKSFLYWDLFNE